MLLQSTPVNLFKNGSSLSQTTMQPINLIKYAIVFKFSTCMYVVMSFFKCIFERWEHIMTDDDTDWMMLMTGKHHKSVAIFLSKETENRQRRYLPYRRTSDYTDAGP